MFKGGGKCGIINANELQLKKETTMKKIVLLMILMLSLSLMIACGNNNNSTSDMNKSSNVNSDTMNSHEGEDKQPADDPVEKADPIKVAVSILPQETFLKAIAGELVEVVVMIPPGNSPANYQPSPKQMVDFNDSQVYFHIDVAAEVNIIDAISNDSMRLVDLAAVSDAAYPARYFEEDNYLEAHDHDHDHDEGAEGAQAHDHSHEGRDPHIWLSPRRVVVMVEEMVQVLSEIDPVNSNVYESNGQAYIETLQALDKKIIDAFSGYENPTFLIYHPAYGYFADDYGLNMIAIESEGKAATIKDLEKVIDYALENNIKAIFYQEEFDSNQAEIVANEINGVTIKVSPLSKDYINSLNEMVEKLKDNLN